MTPTQKYQEFEMDNKSDNFIQAGTYKQFPITRSQDGWSCKHDWGTMREDTREKLEARIDAWITTQARVLKEMLRNNNRRMRRH